MMVVVVSDQGCCLLVGGIEVANGGFIRIEQKTDINLDNVLVSAGTSIDVLMDYFKHHTSEIFQRVVEKEFPNAIPTNDINQ